MVNFIAYDSRSELVSNELKNDLEADKQLN